MLVVVLLVVLGPAKTGLPAAGVVVALLLEVEVEVDKVVVVGAFKTGRP